jgi:hypothetical protein
MLKRVEVDEEQNTSRPPEVKKRRVVVSGKPGWVIARIVQNDEFWNLTADQLRDAIVHYHYDGAQAGGPPLKVVRFLGGEYGLFNERDDVRDDDYCFRQVREEVGGEWQEACEKWHAFSTARARIKGGEQS